MKKCFNSKKRELSYNSNTEENAKRQREERPDVSLLVTAKRHGNAFEESLKPQDCMKIFLDSIKNFEKEVKEFQRQHLN